MQPLPRGPLPDDVLPSLIRFAECFSPELFRDKEESGRSTKIETVPLAPEPPEPPMRLTSFDLTPKPVLPAAPPIVIQTKPARVEAAPEPIRSGKRFGLRHAVSGLAALVVLAAGGAAAFKYVDLKQRAAAPTVVASMPASAIPPETATSEPAVDRLHWWTLREAFDRIGFDLESVASGSANVPRVMLVTLPADLDGINDLDARKDLFLRAFLPVILQVNERILEERGRLVALRTKIAAGATLEGGDVQWLLSLSDAYDQPDIDLDALLRKVDVIPPSLALAQAIEESGWGTSRIARGQNAMFGQFGEDPLGGWDYRAFDSLTSAVESYARNLNTHRAYREFRQSRALMRSRGGPMDATALASTLFRYSERGPLYVKNLRWIIRDNDLRAYDTAHLDAGGKAAVIASNDDARDFDLTRP